MGCLESKLLIERGAFAAGCDLLRFELNAYERTGWTNWYPAFLGMLAEGLAGPGRLSEALASIDQALAKAEHGGELWSVAELLKFNAKIRLEIAGDRSGAAADEHFASALGIARQQGALFWELRAAMGLARLRVRQGRTGDARTNTRSSLRSVYRGLRDR